MTYKIETDYMEHDGGTKYYETVVIHEDSGPAILIKRYGAIGTKMGGGQTIIERGSYSAMDQSRQKILADKSKFRSGKGQYVRADRLDMGLHTAHNRQISAKALVGGVARHFNGADGRAILSYFGITDVMANDVVQEEPAPASAEPVVRDAHWGSW